MFEMQDYILIKGHASAFQPPCTWLLDSDNLFKRSQKIKTLITNQNYLCYHISAMAKSFS